MRLPLLILLASLPGAVIAGAWPRTQGETYVLVSHDGGEDGWTGLYLEHGGPRDLTFGLDVGGHVAGGVAALRRGDVADMAADGRAIAFVRLPLPYGRAPDGPWRMALELGAGADFDVDSADREAEARGRLGLSVGRGFESPWGGGWLNVDLRVEPGGDETRFGLAAVTGLRPMDRLTVSMGVFAEREDDDAVTLAPTLGYEVPYLGEVQVGGRFSEGEERVVVGIARTF
ncbi:MAG: hypothetical protein AAF390_16470 [Pseudomonadota bacterium]